ncbi:MAG: transketolase family protein [Fusobacteriota bacterium]
MEKKSTRDAYGEALLELGEKNKDVVVLDADLSKSTRTKAFGEKYKERFIDIGISEQDLMGTAAGLATSGKIPFASTFAMFAAGRAFEQIRNTIGYPHLNVKICPTHAGISVGEDGGSHQSIEDIALMRTIPGMTVISPADATEAKKAILAAADYEGPMYIRLGRLATPVLFDEDYKFEIGKIKEVTSGTDVTIAATGLMVPEAVEAAKDLEKDGISVRVLNVSTIKPIDEEMIIKAAKETKMIITAEEHSIIGGLGGAVSEVVSENYPTRVLKIGVKDRFGESGPGEQLLEEFNLKAKDIVKKVKDNL